MITAAVRELSFGQAINEAIRQEMRRDPTIIVMGEDVAGGAGRAHLGLIDAWGGPLRATRGLITEFGPERILDTPIAEMGFLGAGVGAAMSGLRPIVEIMFVDLIGCCYDQIMNQAAKMHYMMGGQVDLPLVIRTAYGTRGGDNRTYGGGAGAQHSQTLYSVLAHIPGLKVVVPSTAYNAKGLTIAAIRDNGPVIVLEHKFLGSSAKGSVPEEASPLDEGTILESVSRTRRLVVVDEDTPTASMARDIAARVADKGFDDLDAPIKTVTAPDTPVPFAAVLEALYTPSAAQVISAVHSLFGTGA